VVGAGAGFALLELDAEEPGQLGAVGARVEPGDADGARVGLAQPLQALDGRRLPCAVRAEDPEDLPLFDGERDAVHHGTAAVDLAQAAYFDDRHASRIVPDGARAHRPSRSSGHHPIG